MQSKYVIDTRGNEVIVLKYRGTLNINGVETDEFVIVINDNKDLSHSIEVIEAGEDELLSYEKYFNTFEELCKDIGIECIPNNWIDENNNSGSKYIYTPEHAIISTVDKNSDTYIEQKKETTLEELKAKVESGEAVEVWYSNCTREDSKRYITDIYATYEYASGKLYITGMKCSEELKEYMEHAIRNPNGWGRLHVELVYNNSDKALKVYYDVNKNNTLHLINSIQDFADIFIASKNNIGVSIRGTKSDKTLRQLIREWEKKNKPVNKRVVKETIIKETEVPDVNISKETLDMIREINTDMMDEFKSVCEELIEKLSINKEDITTEKVEEYTVPNLTFNRKKVDGVDWDELMEMLELKGALLIASQPGTGKTTLSREIAYTLTSECKISDYNSIVTAERTLMLGFNSDTSYGDTIGGPRCNNGIWAEEEGNLKKFFDAANRDLDNIYVVILDEINRVADISSALGETLTAMEQRGVAVVTNRGTKLVVPRNIRFIATMNTYDTSTIRLDKAIKDRFTIFPMTDTILKAENIKPKAGVELLKCMNETIDIIVDTNNILAKDPMRKEENKIGFRHLYDNYSSINGLKLVIKRSIIPSILDNLDNLEEYDVKEVMSNIELLRVIGEERL